MTKTLFDKLWDEHTIRVEPDGTSLLYIDRHLIHEVTSPQAFEGLQVFDRKVWRTHANFAVPDHVVPSTARNLGISDEWGKVQVDTLINNVSLHGIPHYGINDHRQGIVHVIGPEQGIVIPGMTVVCGDSHTSTHGALAALAQGIGTSEVEHVLATQTLLAKKAKNMLVKVDGVIPHGCSPKDLALALIGKIGTAGGTGHAIEYRGTTISSMSMEGRMTLCNMAIEAGARFGLVAFDDITCEYVKGRPYSPKGRDWDLALMYWKTLQSDAGVHFDRVVEMSADDLEPQLTWGTSPEMVIGVGGSVPDPKSEVDSTKRESLSRALKYMGLSANQSATSIPVDKIFIGSCTNSRIEDLRAAAGILKRLGARIAPNIKLALVVPGSGLVKEQAEAEGLQDIFEAAGFEWREPSCSMCLAMNGDRLEPGERCASTSNRNFEGRQGAGGRTHLVSPQMAAAAAVSGHFIDVRRLF